MNDILKFKSLTDEDLIFKYEQLRGMLCDMVMINDEDFLTEIALCKEEVRERGFLNIA